MTDIIFDVDGTLMNINHRRHYLEGKKKDWESFRQKMVDDTPNEHVVMMAKMLKDAGHRIIISTGRLESDKDLTLDQIGKAGVRYDLACFRDLDQRYMPDFVVKEMMLSDMMMMGYNPTIAFDDRDSVVEMWRTNGLHVFQVDKGDF